MSRLAEVFSWLRQCPQLGSLYPIAGTEEAGVSVIYPQGASARVRYDESLDVLDGYECNIVPFPSVYEDFQVNCFAAYDVRDGSEPEVNVNVLSYDEVQAVCDWIAEQDESGNLPEITGKDVVSVECNPMVPQVRYVTEQANVVAYFITVRVRYVNTARGRSVYYERNGQDLD